MSPVGRPRRPARHAAALGFLALAALGTATCVNTASDAQAAASEIAIRELLDVWQTADTAALVDLFWPDAVYDDFQNQVTYRGLEEIVGYVMDVQTWASQIYMNVTDVHAGPTSASAEWIFSAVQDAPMGDRVPVATGREVVLNGVTIIELERGRIVRAADYFDTAPLVLQLGGRIVMPGGDTVTLETAR